MMMMEVICGVPTTPYAACSCYSTGDKNKQINMCLDTVQELCESRGGRPGLSVLTSLLVSVDIKLY